MNQARGGFIFIPGPPSVPGLVSTSEAPADSALPVSSDALLLHSLHSPDVEHARQTAARGVLRRSSHVSTHLTFPPSRCAPSLRQQASVVAGAHAMQCRGNVLIDTLGRMGGSGMHTGHLSVGPPPPGKHIK